MDNSINTTSKKEDIRTQAQNNALHLFFQQLSDELNEKGITMKAVLENFNLEVPATKYGIKEYIWRPLQESMLGKKSTKDLLKKKEIDMIWDSLNKFFAEQMKLQIPPFPSYESKMYEND